MERITMTLETSNAAFDYEGAASEIARIMREAAARIERDGMAHPAGIVLRDVNGNRCGLLTIEGSN
jgi:hypothetical protein